MNVYPTNIAGCAVYKTDIHIQYIKTMELEAIANSLLKPGVVSIASSSSLAEEALAKEENTHTHTRTCGHTHTK